MGDLGLRRSYWDGKRVAVTGHSGFKGSWLCLLLTHLGAEVHGYSRGVGEFPLCDEFRPAVKSVQGDVSDAAALATFMQQCEPDVVFHLGAQALVSEGFVDPVGTWTTNAVGTVAAVDAAAKCNVGVVVVITSDKCYENTGEARRYVESDRLGGADPYSASKAAAELAVSSCPPIGTMSVVSARAGNVIGGGDWAENRLLPDCMRSFQAGSPVVLRRPQATRPWQHVFEPLVGYLVLAQWAAAAQGRRGSWNFGPDETADGSVLFVAERAAEAWGESAVVEVDASQIAFHEAAVLAVDSTKAMTELGWRSIWDLETAVDETVRWYQHWARGDDMRQFSIDQINTFLAAADP